MLAVTGSLTWARLTVPSARSSRRCVAVPHNGPTENDPWDGWFDWSLWAWIVVLLAVVAEAAYFNA